jgi:alpha-beta hydrolase superfamily lysophospholipase
MPGTHRFIATLCIALLPCALGVAQPNPAPITWPERWQSAAAGAGAAGVIRTPSQSIATWRARILQEPLDRPSAEDLADWAALAGPEGETPRPEPRFERRNGFVFAFEPVKPDGAPQTPAEVFTFISGRPIDPSADAPTVRIERTWFALYPPLHGADDHDTPQPPRGVVLLVPGLFGTPGPIVDMMVAELRSHGWAILRMLAHPSRFTERVEFVVDRADEAAGADRIARELTDRAAECALAAQTAFSHVARVHPDWAALPRAALGMSGGAMVMPTIIAREPDAYSAVVLIAGGADFLRIVLSSNYSPQVGAVRVRWMGDPPTEADGARLDSLYLSRAPLDSYHTAARVKRKPILMLHGSADRAVPADTGDVLWERLGRPERWVEPVGHEMLFMGLPSRMGAIADWLDHQVRNTP